MKSIKRRIAKLLFAVMMVAVLVVVGLPPQAVFAETVSGQGPGDVTIRFDVNGGEALDKDSLIISKRGNSKIVLPCPTHPDPRYTFAGWYTDPYRQGFRLMSTSIRDYIADYDDDREDLDAPSLTELTLYAKYELFGTRVTVPQKGRPVRTQKAKRKRVEIEIAKWNIKKNPTITLDLNRYAKAGFKWAPIDIKIGTATLKNPAKENMILESSWFNKLICYKGKKVADVYIRRGIKVTKNKKHSVKGVFAYDPMTCQCGESYCKFLKNVGDEIYNFNVTEIYDEDRYRGDIYTFYKDRHVLRKPGSYVTDPEVKKNFRITVVNKKQNLTGKLNKKSDIYKSAQKMVGGYSPSCTATSLKFWKKITVDGFGDGMGGINSAYVMLVPVNKARAGDWLYHRGHDSVYLGGGQSLHGSVTSHKTWIGPSEIRPIAYAARSNYFWFYKKVYRK
jgi:hypothetical protein